MVQKIVDSLNQLERTVLPIIKNNTAFEELLEKSHLQEVELQRALQWLENKKLISGALQTNELLELDENGKKYRKGGLPEKKFLQTIKNDSLTYDQLIKKSKLEKQEISACIGLLKQKAAIQVTKEKEPLFTITTAGKALLLKNSLEEELLQEHYPLNVKDLKPEQQFAYENLIKRKNMLKTIIQKKRSYTLTSLGKKATQTKLSSKNIINSLTSKELKSGSWKNKKFRRYDVTINVPAIHGGKRHFVNQATEYIKKIWIEMGFVEMTGDLVQSAFWNLDTLFVPQDHPARAMQDSFYIKNPKKAKLPEWHKKIKEVHENGADTGSSGWGTPWSSEIASENMLRTHTTVLSSQFLRKIHDGEYTMPAKFFSVNKVFRNEALDWKHLFEFNQVEGIVVDPNGNLEQLKGYLAEFFGKMGFKKIRMKPAHFPYTEPSVEVEGYNEIKKEWVELTGAGIFRPEMTKPLLGVEVPVLAWGIGMERVIMEYFNIVDIRDLYYNDLKQLREMKIFNK
ncbi:phenylalanine--tRNA ligase subunit alpha [Candidatus Woesearchaeota archaeon]|nr:phenylalanine--tRNA ligase subunit alpha [Candidatus Woesearchaeota archaeon]